jgi:hypothetical protein
VKLIEFKPNDPQSFRLASTVPVELPEGRGCLYTTTEGDLLHLTASVSDSLGALKLEPGELFAICCYQSGRGVPEWNVWLMPETEKARARREVATLDLEAQLAASLKVVQGGGRVGALAPVLAPTGTEGGPVPVPLPRKLPALAVASGKRRGGGAIPLNVAFREILQFVCAELKASGEQWADESRQDLISTVMIAAQKANLLTVWERKEDAA